MDRSINDSSTFILLSDSESKSVKIFGAKNHSFAKQRRKIAGVVARDDHRLSAELEFGGICSSKKSSESNLLDFADRNNNSSCGEIVVESELEAVPTLKNPTSSAIVDSGNLQSEPSTFLEEANSLYLSEKKDWISELIFTPSADQKNVELARNEIMDCAKDLLTLSTPIENSSRNYLLNYSQSPRLRRLETIRKFHNYGRNGIQPNDAYGGDNRSNRTAYPEITQYNSSTSELSGKPSSRVNKRNNSWARSLADLQTSTFSAPSMSSSLVSAPDDCASHITAGRDIPSIFDVSKNFVQNGRVSHGNDKAQEDVNDILQHYDDYSSDPLNNKNNNRQNSAYQSSLTNSSSTNSASAILAYNPLCVLPSMVRAGSKSSPSPSTRSLSVFTTSAKSPPPSTAGSSVTSHSIGLSGLTTLVISPISMRTLALPASSPTTPTSPMMMRVRRPFDRLQSVEQLATNGDSCGASTSSLTLISSSSLTKNDSMESDMDGNGNFASKPFLFDSPISPRSLSMGKMFAYKSLSPQLLGTNKLYSETYGRSFTSLDPCRHDLNLFANTPASSYLEMQNISVIEWLREKSTIRLAELFHHYSLQKTVTPAKRKLMRFDLDLLKGFRNAVKSAKCKALNDYSLELEPLCSDKLYGMALSVVNAKTTDGSPIPRFARQIMDYILENAGQVEGIFRKNGVKLRIQEIRNRCTSLNVNDPLPHDLLHESQLHNLADAFKQYLRDLPECLMTNRISAMLESTVLDLPEEKRFLALHYCILLLPAENREALIIILRFLHEIAKLSAKNHMCAENLATCLMPSLFYLPHSTGGPMTRLSRRKTIGVPSERDRNAYNALKEVLTRMIRDYELLLKIPTELAGELKTLNFRTDIAPLQMPLKNGAFDFREEFVKKFRNRLERLKNDYLNGWKDWHLERVYPDGTRLFEKKSGNEDLLPKEFMVQTSVDASANRLHALILHERHLWDRNVIKCQRVGSSGQDFDVIEVTYDGINTNKRSYLARRWTYGGVNSSDSNKFCSLIERSVAPSGVRDVEPKINVYKSEFFIVPNHSDPSQSDLTYISRIDLRGKTSLWYKKVYGEMVAEQIRRLRSFFATPSNITLQCRNATNIETLV